MAHLEGLLAQVVAINVEWLRQNPECPRIYESDITYGQHSETGEETLQTIPDILMQGWADCDGLSCWRAAELIVLGIDRGAGVRIERSEQWRPDNRVYHAVVFRTTAKGYEDPSAYLIAKAMK